MLTGSRRVSPFHINHSLHDFLCALQMLPLLASAAHERSGPPKAFGCAAPNFIVMPPTLWITGDNTPSAIARPRNAIFANFGRSASTPRLALPASLTAGSWKD